MDDYYSRFVDGFCHNFWSDFIECEISFMESVYYFHDVLHLKITSAKLVWNEPTGRQTLV